MATLHDWQQGAQLREGAITASMELAQGLHDVRRACERLRLPDTFGDELAREAQQEAARPLLYELKQRLDALEGALPGIVELIGAGRANVTTLLDGWAPPTEPTEEG